MAGLALLLVGCGKIADPIVEHAIRNSLKKSYKERLTEEDLQKVTELNLTAYNLTDAGLKDLAKLQNLQYVNLYDTKVTEAGVAELQKALPKCRISHEWY